MATATDTGSFPTEFISDGNVKCRIVPWGECRWRLESADAQGVFRHKGAIQALSFFMGEDEPRPLADTNDGTHIEISSNPFSIKIFSPSGKPVQEIISISRNGEKTVVKGRLLDEEAIYGGGERFDSLNKRGRSFTLFTEDGWNRADTTYIAIPFFTTTRGGGFLVNAYEPMTADFGKCSANEWAIELDGTHSDIFIFATEKPADAIESAYRLMGEGSLPRRWNQGPLICRYWPDLSFFEGKRLVTRRNKSALGYGAKDIYEKHCEIGVSPTAMLIEPWPLGNFFDNTEEAVKIRKYFGERNIPLMIWMYVGSVLSKSVSGFRPEFLVHVDIYQDDKLVEPDTSYIPKIVGRTINPDSIGQSGKGVEMLDITNPEAWDWYINCIWRKLADNGIRGAKIDFCELMPDDSVDYGGLCVKYKWKNPEVFDGAAVHHAYPSFFIAKLFKEASKMLEDEGGFMAFARGGGIGLQRAPYSWAGDQTRTFAKLREQLRAMLNAGMSGMPFLTCDMAGYKYERDVPSVELEGRVFARAAEFFAYSPVVQTHGDVLNVYELPIEVQEIYRTAMAERKKRAGELDDLLKVSCRKGMPVMRPLVLAFPDDKRTWDIDDEFMYGDNLLVAPILDDVEERKVYLPKGRWIREDKADSPQTYTAEAGGIEIAVEAPLGVIPLFRRIDDYSANE